MPLVIAKTVLPDAQKFYLALGRIFGIGRAQGLAIAEEVGVSKEARVSDVKAAHVRQVGCGSTHLVPVPASQNAGIACYLG
jgi:ribosomal protein S13